MSTRREFLISSVSLAVAGAATRALAADPKSEALNHAEEMAKLAPNWLGKESIAMLVYPGFTALDFFGPHHMFISLMGAKVHVVAESLDLVSTDTGIAIRPTMTLDDCPDDLTIVFVPGGTKGTLDACENPRITTFLKERGERAEFVTSVCTGSLVLGAAGLLDGYRATTHWVCRDQLSLFGAIPVDERVVIDRNRITGAGVTSGLDFGLGLVQRLRGDEYAQAVQLFSEYDPHPGLNAGSTRTAPVELVETLAKMHQQFNVDIAATAKRVRTAQ